MDAGLTPLQWALTQHQNQMLNQLPSESELAATHVFSVRFTRRMARLLRQAARQKGKKLSVQAQQVSGRLRKRLLVAAIVIALLTSLFSVTSARETVVRFIIDIYDTFTTVVFPKEHQSGDPGHKTGTNPIDFDTMLPDAVPAGYHLTSRQLNGQSLHVVYTNQQHESIFLYIHASDQEQLILDSEQTKAETLLIAGHDGFFYANKGTQALLWQIDKLTVHLFGMVDKAELIRMAESMSH